METNREKYLAMLDLVPDSKIGYVLAFLCGMITSDAAEQDRLALIEEGQENTADKEG